MNFAFNAPVWLHQLYLPWKLTHFGATVLLLPYSMLIALWLWNKVGRRDALLWCACIAGLGLTTALLKIWFSGCGLHVWNVHSPSGHTAFSALAYGGFTVIAMAGSHSLRAKTFRLATALWVLMIGYTRVHIHAHTPEEVLVGILIGCFFLAIFARYYSGRARPPYLLAGAIMLAVVVIGLSLPRNVAALEPWLVWLGQLIAPYRDLLCPAV